MLVLSSRRIVPALCALALLAIPIAGCGGSGDAKADSGDNSDQARLDFARCMRKNGVNIPDPQPGQRGGLRFRQRVGSGITPARMDKAMKACQKLLPNGGPGNQTPEERAKFRDAALKFAQCMRSHGVNIPDPQPGTGGIRIGGPGSAINPNSPTFQNAQKTCEKLLPKPPGGGGPGRGPQ